MNLVAASFAWPFRGAWQSRFAFGALIVLFLPIAFLPLLGYAVAATRGAAAAQGPPPWKLSGRLIVDGFWMAVVLTLLSAPFVIALNPLAGAIDSAHLWHVSDRPLSRAYADVGAIVLLALPWGLLLLLLMPHATSRFAATGRPRDLFDFPASIRGVRRDFSTWNLVAAAIVTGWALGAACVGVFCIGLLPGVFYAILVSAHASASLHSPARSSGENPPAG